jgi:hypothetical protein
MRLNLIHHAKCYRATILLTFTPINHGILWGPDASQATPRMFDDLDLPAQRRLDPGDEAACIVPTLSPDELEPREAALERSQQEFAAVIAAMPPF